MAKFKTCLVKEYKEQQAFQESQEKLLSSICSSEISSANPDRVQLQSLMSYINKNLTKKARGGTSSAPCFFHLTIERTQWV